MKIAFITLGYKPLRTSGLDISGERLVEALLHEGHQVTVIAGKRGPIEETHVHPNLKIQRIPLGKTDWIGFGYRSAQLLDRLGTFDIVHFWDVHFGWSYRGKYVAGLQHSFRQRITSLGDFHFSPSQIYRLTYYTLAKHLAEIPSIRRARGLLAGSATTRDEFITNYRIGPERVAIVRHGIDTEFFQRTPNTDALRQELGIAEGEPVILFVGFITPRKGLEYLAQALSHISPMPRLVLVGMWRNEGYRQQVYRSFGRNQRLIVEAGFVPDEQLPAYYSLADVYVATTLMEGFGLPFAEALSCKTPVVTTGVGSTAEVLGPGGVLVPARDPSALAEAVSNLLKDPDMRDRMGSEGRQHIVDEFSIQAMLSQAVAAYERFRA
jgi:MMP alpha-(1->4)-mannosyltransferase